MQLCAGFAALPEVLPWRNLNNPKRRPVEVFAGVSNRDNIAGQYAEGTHAGLEFNIGIPRNGLVEAERHDSGSLVVIRYTQHVRRRADLKSATLNIVRIDQRHAILLVGIEAILKLEAKTIWRVGGPATCYAKRRRLVVCARNPRCPIGSIAEFVYRPAAIQRRCRITVGG